MRKFLLLGTLAVAGLSAVPDTGEAGILRRRARSAACPPVVVCPCPSIPAPLAVQTATIKGKTYWLYDLPGADEYRDEAETPALTAQLPDPNNTFKGTDRKVPKTTIVTDAPVKTFDTVAAVLATLVPDAEMKASSGLTPSSATRVPAEKRNVKVTGFIHAFKKESDNDYHVILGDGPDAEPAFMNVEVSGIPVGGTTQNRTQLATVRNVFKTALQTGETGPAGYKKPHDPIPVRVTGSLFWDVDHPAGVVGPTGMRPKTAWEIHPVSEIEFLDP